MARFLLVLLATAAALARDEAPRSGIVGGGPVAPGDWEDAAGVLYGEEVGCTGVLIAPDLALTADHCNWGVTGVTLATTDWVNDRGPTLPVVATHSYPNSWRTYDIAVLELGEASDIPPRLLALDCIADGWLYDGATVTVVGYGATDEWGAVETTVLHEAVTTIRDADCGDLDAGCNEDVSPGGELIAGGDGVDSCNGDSGGPLYLHTPRGDFLVGITSRAAEPSSRPCGDGGIYARPDAIVDWIEATSGRTLPRPDCSDLPSNEPPEPWADTIEVVQGAEGLTTIEPNDPDASDRHTFAIAEAPTHGRADLLPEGRVRYTAPIDYVGSDRVVITVTDNGSPRREADVAVEVNVLERAEERRCGCGPSGPAVLWLWALALVAARRR